MADITLQESTAGADTQSAILISATLHLMSHYSAQGGCLKLAAVIERHLKALAQARDLTPVLRATCEQLAEQWAQVVEHTMPRQPRRSLFGRLLAPAV
ncbi:hypothetical protein V8J88_17235 [Massilia sp. W12]|uniref:hypothetical protein n=1 Tax=Massilia sp. W12 TaxID=3126507 RepID=UPI0030D4B2DC